MAAATSAEVDRRAVACSAALVLEELFDEVAAAAAFAPDTAAADDAPVPVVFAAVPVGVEVADEAEVVTEPPETLAAYCAMRV